MVRCPDVQMSRVVVCLDVVVSLCGSTYACGHPYHYMYGVYAYPIPFYTPLHSVYMVYVSIVVVHMLVVMCT